MTQPRCARCCGQRGYRGLQFGCRTARAIERGRVRERKHARGKRGFRAYDASNLLVRHLIVSEDFAYTHGDIRKRRQFDPAFGYFLCQLAHERKCDGRGCRIGRISHGGARKSCHVSVIASETRVRGGDNTHASRTLRLRSLEKRRPSVCVAVINSAAKSYAMLGGRPSAAGRLVCRCRNELQ